MKNAAALMALATLVIAASSAHAAEQGGSGATSKGSISISVSVAVQAKIAPPADIAIDDVATTTTENRSQDLCIWSNSTSNRYSVTAIGSGIGGAFALPGAARGYAVAWGRAGEAGSAIRLLPGMPLADQIGSTASPTCATGGKTASLRVDLPAGTRRVANAGPETGGTLTLLIAPM